MERGDDMDEDMALPAMLDESEVLEVLGESALPHTHALSLSSLSPRSLSPSLSTACRLSLDVSSESKRCDSSQPTPTPSQPSLGIIMSPTHLLAHHLR
jgi:hypothetical protein